MKAWREIHPNLHILSIGNRKAGFIERLSSGAGETQTWRCWLGTWVKGELLGLEWEINKAKTKVEQSLPMNNYEAMREALLTAINTVECASVDPVTKEELPWYKQAKAALREYDAKKVKQNQL